MIVPATYDLHMHTYWSYDGSTNPEAYFQKAQELGLRCIAITEHHNMDSFEEAFTISEKYPKVSLVSAVELTVTTSIGAVDLLCYGLPRHPMGSLAQILDEYHNWQCDAGKNISRMMQEWGYPYSDQVRLKLLQSYRLPRVLAVQGSTHVKADLAAKYFHEQGYVATYEDARELRFEKIEKTINATFPGVRRVVDGVKEAGGIVVLAHPSLYIQEDDFAHGNLASMDLLRDECSLDGIECAHPLVSAELTPIYRNYCIKHGLVSTGGSDCHSEYNVKLSTLPWQKCKKKRFADHIGVDSWLDEFFERLKKPQPEKD